MPKTLKGLASFSLLFLAALAGYYANDFFASWRMRENTPTPRTAPRPASSANSLEIIGLAPSLEGETVVFFTDETAAGEDLNGDGDLKDNVLRLFDLGTRRDETLALDGVVPVLQGNRLIFHTSESAVGEDLNGDGDLKDIVIRQYDLDEGRQTGPALTGSYPASDGQRIAFHVFERWTGEDLNGDGDLEDTVIQIYDLHSNVLFNTGVEGVRASIFGNRMAFHTYEFLEGRDLNGDGDTNDTIVQLYDLATKTLTPVRFEGKYPILARERMAFQVNEASIGEDLNGDGDALDDIVRLYNLESGRLEEGTFTGSFVAFDGSTLAFSTQEAQVEADLSGDGDLDDYVLEIYDLGTQRFLGKGLVGISPTISGGQVVFATLETWIHKDLNRDNLIGDYVLQAYRFRP